MPTFTRYAAEIWRNFTTDGVPASGAHRPAKGEIRQWGLELEALVEASAPLASPAFTDHPTAPTPPTIDATTRIATMAAVHAVAASIGTGPAGLGYGGSSTASNTIGAGSKTFAVNPAILAYIVGDRVRFAASPSAWMEGEVTAYAAGSMTATITHTSGSGTYAAWSLSIAGVPGAGDVAAHEAAANPHPVYRDQMNAASENVFYDVGAPEYSSRTSAAVDNGDGTFTINTAYVITSYAATGRLVPGKRCALAVRPVTGGVTPASSWILFRNSGGATLSTVTLGAVADAYGYYSAENIVIPATTATIEVKAQIVTSGDRLEIIFAPGAYTYAARANGTSRPVVALQKMGRSLPVSLTSSRGAVQALVRPNGTMGIWESILASRGSSASSGTLAALRSLEEDLRITGLLDKIVYLNMRVGNDATAALVPFIDRAGHGFDSAPASFTSFAEASGLASAITIDTGVIPRTCGMSRYGVSIGCYLLNDVASSGTQMITTDVTAPSFLSLNPNLFGYHDFDAYGSGAGRILTPSPNVTATKGTIIGARSMDGTNRISRQGVVLNTAVTQQGDVPSGSVTINFARGTSGGDFLGLDLDPDQIAAMHWSLHAFNVAIGRGVTADGVF